jgi:hypothetical protein
MTPRVDPATTEPALSMGWYLYFFISGRATVLIVAAVAVFDPLMAEKRGTGHDRRDRFEKW